jgi:hypothetical protein
MQYYALLPPTHTYRPRSKEIADSLQKEGCCFPIP